MAQPGIPDLFSSVVQSVKDACESHLQFRDFVSVSGFICLDIDGCSQERLVLAELIPGNKDHKEGSFTLEVSKALNWANVRKKSKTRLNCQRQTSNENHGENVSNRRRAKETLSREGQPTPQGNENISSKKELLPSHDQERNSKSVHLKFCSRRNDLRNLTFTLGRKHEAATRPEEPAPSSTLLPSAVNKIGGIAHTQNKIGTSHNGGSKGRLKRSVSNCTEQRKSDKGIICSQTVFNNQQRVNILDRLINHEQRLGDQSSQRNNISLQNDKEKLNSTANFTNRQMPALDFPDKDCCISEVKRPFLVNHKSREDFKPPRSHGADATNSNSWPPGHKKAELFSIAVPECRDEICGGTKESNSNEDDTAGCVDVKTAGYTLSDTMAATTPSLRMMADGKESVLSRSSLAISPCHVSMMAATPTRDAYDGNFSLSGAQALKKKKRLVKWIGMFKRGRKPDGLRTEGTWSRTNTSVTDLSPSLADSALSIQHQT